MRLARDAAVNPAALPPIMTICSMSLGLEVLLSGSYPRTLIRLTASLDELVIVLELTDARSFKPGCLDHLLDFGASEGGPYRGFDLLPHTAAVARRTFFDSAAHFESHRSFKIADQQG